MSSLAVCCERAPQGQVVHCWHETTEGIRTCCYCGLKQRREHSFTGIKGHGPHAPVELTEKWVRL